MRILLIEDETPLATAVLEHLRAENHVCDWFATLDEALSAVLTSQYDLILLDLQLPDGDGLGLLARVRSMPHYTSIIVLTARDKISDRIKGLNLGADDYVLKPFDLNELSARIATVTRRHLENASQKIRIGDLEFDLGLHVASRLGEMVPLTPSEWSLMECLLRRKSSVIPKSSLEESLYTFGKEIESNTIEAHVSRLRSKLGKDVIITHRGLGYSLAR